MTTDRSRRFRLCSKIEPATATNFKLSVPLSKGRGNLGRVRKGPATSTNLRWANSSQCANLYCNISCESLLVRPQASQCACHVSVCQREESNLQLGHKAPTCNQHKAHSCTGVKTAKTVNNYCSSPGVMTSPGGFDRPHGLISPLT